MGTSASGTNSNVFMGFNRARWKIAAEKEAGQSARD